MIKIGNWWFAEDDTNRQDYADAEWGTDPLNSSMINEINSWFKNKDKKHAIDIGANIGFITAYFGTHWEHVTAFEPTPSIFECLQKNCNKPNIKLINKALSNTEKNVLFATSGRSEINQIVSDTQFLKKRWGHITVPAITLDSLNLTNVDIIKIDVEGHELSVVYGAEQTIKNNKPLIVIEISYENKILDREVSSLNHGHALTILKEWGYRVIWNHRYDWILEPI
jgi:FkbM family methyltransferase